MQASVDATAVPTLLLGWYDAHARRLPWRALPDAPRPDPYRVWLSEVMLQQTTVAAVTAYFARFLSLWPTVHDLAAADDADVMAAWAGLGYYARARNLLACAREVARIGAFPDTEEALRALPGLGAYTAAAVAAIAFDRRAVVVDANVERVVSRLFAIETPLPLSRPAIREATDAITPDARAGDFAQAMMDLGATVCTVRNPRCLLCPLRTHCRAHAQGEPERLPAKAAKRPSHSARGAPSGSSATAMSCSSPAQAGACWAVCAPCPTMAGARAPMAMPRRRTLALRALAESCGTASRTSISNCN